jgi:hypothetical protein
MPHRSSLTRRTRTVLVLACAAWAGPAWGLEPVSSVSFAEHSYAHRLTIDQIPACPGLLDTLYAMDTMRRLTPFVDRVTMLEEQADRHVVQVDFGMLGFRTTLVYERIIVWEDQHIELRLLSHDSTFPLVQFPSDFLATYRVGSDGGHTQLRYTQDATVQRPAALHHQLFVRAQIGMFERRLLGVIEEACP